jgi:hypothetical protein
VKRVERSSLRSGSGSKNSSALDAGGGRAFPALIEFLAKKGTFISRRSFCGSALGRESNGAQDYGLLEIPGSLIFRT